MEYLILLIFFVVCGSGYAARSSVLKSRAFKALRDAEEFTDLESIRERLAPFGIKVMPDTAGFPRLADVGSVCFKKRTEKLTERAWPPCGYCPGKRPMYEIWDLVAEPHGYHGSPNRARWQTKCVVCIHCGGVSRAQGPFPGDSAFSDLLGSGDNLNDLLDPFEGVKFDIGGRVRALMEAQRQTFLKRLEEGEIVLRQRERLLTAKPGS